MVEPARAHAERYTYADILTWPEDERWELIDGVAYDMTPAPTYRHQEILGRLYLQFGNFLEGAPCRVVMAPLDVRMPKLGETAMTASTVVQPDLLVVCEPEQIDERGVVGAPTLVLEILSPSTAKKDLREKLNAYQQAGVQEYWVVYPSEKMVQVYTLDEHGRYGTPSVYVNGEQAPVGVLPGLAVDLGRVFAG